MANPTKFSRPVQNPALLSRAFAKGREADRQAFIDEQGARGFRVLVTQRFNGRDMKTRQPIKVWVVHVYAKAES